MVRPSPGPGVSGAKFWIAVLTEILGPRRRRRVHRRLRRAQGAARSDHDRVATDGGADLPYSSAAQRLPVCVPSVLGRDVTRPAADLSPEHCVQGGAPTAVNEPAAKEQFTEFASKWGPRYPAIVRLWDNAWSENAAVPRLRPRHQPGHLFDGCNRQVSTRSAGPFITSFPRSGQSSCVGGPRSVVRAGRRPPRSGVP